MKKIQKISYGLPVMAVCIGLASIYSCKKEGQGLSLNQLPKPDFEVVTGSNANNLVLVNKTDVPSIAYWKVSTGASLQGDSAKLGLVFAGTYTVKMIVTAQGGIDSVTKTITIASSDPTACVNTPLGFLAGCTQKTWKLLPEAGAYKVGEGAGNGNWWSSGAGDVAGRSCEFNDEYTFSFNAVGTFTYDNKGDFYADGSLGNNTSGCEPTANYTAAQKPWGSGTFTYSFTPGAGVKGLGQITVKGLGAHIGLQKVYNGGENASGPQSSAITYDVLEMSANPAGYSVLRVGVNIGGAGWWTFALRSY